MGGTDGEREKEKGGERERECVRVLTCVCERLNKLRSKYPTEQSDSGAGYFLDPFQTLIPQACVCVCVHTPARGRAVVRLALR